MGLMGGKRVSLVFIVVFLFTVYLMYSVITRRTVCKGCYEANLMQGGHRPGKRGKTGKLRKFEKLSKSQGKLREI